MKLKHAQGRAVDVPEDQIEAYTSLGWEKVVGEPDTHESVPSKSWKVDALNEYAEEHGIDLGSASKKDEILAAITAAGESNDEGSEVVGEPDTHEPQIADAE